MIWFLLACTDAPSTEDTSASAQDTHSPIEDHGLFAEHYSYTELWLGWDGKTIQSFESSTGETIHPHVRVEFFTIDWLPEKSPDKRCEWVGDLDGLTLTSSEEGAWAELNSTIPTMETSCGEWEGIDAAMSAEKLLGFGDLTFDLANDLLQFFNLNGENWTEIQPYVGALLITQSGLTTEPLVEAGYFFAYPLEDGKMTQKDGTYVPMEMNGEMPLGAIHALGVYSFAAQNLVDPYLE